MSILAINLDALIANLNVYKSFLKPATKIMVMVKASAYGSGSVDVSKLLEKHQIDYLGVAFAEEGVELRRAGIQTPILVLNPNVESFQAIIKYNLEPTIYSLHLFQQFFSFLPKEKKANIHLKLDTGMHRLGFEKKDIKDLVSIFQQYTGIKVISVFSHLAASDEAVHDEFTKQQVKRFLTMYQQVEKTIGYSPTRHILNTSGIVRFSHYQMDMVRLGIGIYGTDSSGLIQDRLQVVNTLKASISQIRTVAAKETVGYNRKGKINSTKRIGTINIGYGDGLSRACSNGNHSVFLHGKKAKIVGTVCMDMCMIDLNEIPEAKEGDVVELFGENNSVIELAKKLQTIPYEIFTGISKRVKRVYKTCSGVA